MTNSEPSTSPSEKSSNAAVRRSTTEMIRQARIDPSTFLRYLLMAPGVRDPMAPVHTELQNHLSTHRHALVELPRDHGKTTQVCLRVLWELGRDPNLRIKIVCASEAGHPTAHAVRLARNPRAQSIKMIDNPGRHWEPNWLWSLTNFRSCHRSVKQHTGKASRVGVFAVPVQNGTVRLKGTAGIVDASQQELFDEMTTFPFGSHDDLLDATATGTEYLQMQRKPRLWV